MGSDDGGKSPQTCFSRFQKRHWMMIPANLQGNTGLVVVTTLSLLSLFLLFHLVLPPPEILLSDTFTPSQARFPPQCQTAAENFFRCQEEDSATAASAAELRRRTLILTCHRKWCNSWGHCEPCAGIGDRMRFLLSQVHQAATGTLDIGGDKKKKKCVRVLLDYPLNDVATLESAIYKDRAGWLGEWLRYRSYKSSSYLKKGISTTSGTPQRDEQQREQSPLVTFQHFQPDGYHVIDYDPCFFHLLFQPTPSMQADIDRHNAAIQGVVRRNEHQEDYPSIGIHFRTGDELAFGIHLNDTRVSSDDLAVAWKKMLACADQLASKLFPKQQASSSVRYFLATDNDYVKEWARSDKAHWIYTTTVKPESSWGAVKGDRDAWMELYLLSQRQGLVVNVLPKHGYHGPAFRRSCFSMLAQRIGWIDDGRVQECALDN